MNTSGLHSNQDGENTGGSLPQEVRSAIKTVPTYTATIYIGLKDRDSGRVFGIDTAHLWLEDYVLCGLCVTLTPTTYIYKNGDEPGLIVGLINYPRFPSSPREIRDHALKIAEGLRLLLCQKKVSVVFPDETVMLSSSTGEL